MAENTGIEWAHHTFNPWMGCTKVSPACDNCYAERDTARWKLVDWGPHAARRRTKTWGNPVRWDRQAAEDGVRYRVFCASLADVFDNHGSITSGWRGDLWHLIHRTPNLDWLLLTKRPQNIGRYLRPEEYGPLPSWGDGWPNVWIGATVENQAEADRRIPHLLKIPARVRFLSCEPLLGPVDLEPWLPWPDARCYPEPRDDEPFGCIGCDDPCRNCPENKALYRTDVGPIGADGCPEWVLDERATLHWVIAGGESGPNYREADPDWYRSLRDQCAAAGVPFLFKQWHGPNQKAIKAKGRALDGVVHDGYPETT